MPVVKRYAGLHRLVDSHMRCQGCDYDLIGLRFGGKCPECGAPIRSPVRIAGSVNDAPIIFLHRLRVAVFALLAATISLPLAIASFFFGGALAISLLLMAVLASAAWVYAVFILTLPTPGRAEDATTPHETALRIATRALTASWALVLGVPLMARLGAPFSDVAMYLFWVAGAIGACTGFTLLSITVARLAGWANDLDLGHSIRGASVAIAFLCAGFLILTTLSVLGAPPTVLLFFYLGGAMLALGVAAWNAVLYLRFAALLAWAPANAEKSIERARARGERAVQRIAEGQAKHEVTPHFDVVKPPIRAAYIAPSHAESIDVAPDSAPVPPPVTPPIMAKPGKPTIHADTPLPPLPKRRPAPAPDVNRKKDEMI